MTATSRKSASIKLILVDGSSYIFRAYHATERQPLTSPAGIPTGATYVFTNMLRRLVREENPTHIAVVWDAPGKTFRDHMFPGYKAKRKETPADLIPQFDWIRKVVDGFRIATLEKEGFEADDVIGTIAVKAADEGAQVVIVSSDKDLMQFVGPSVTMLDTMKDKITDVAAVKEKFGVEPEKVKDILALWGDASDNVPGVPSVGEVRAVELIRKYGTLDSVLKHADEVKGKMGENLREFADQARLSMKLVTIDCKVPVKYKLSDLEARDPDHETLAGIFRELGFKKLLAEFGAEHKTVSYDQYRLITDEQALKELIKELKEAGRFAIDLETTSLDPILAEIVGLSFAAEPHRAAYIPVGHANVKKDGQLDRDKALDLFKPLLIDPHVEKIGHNIKYDDMVLRGAGIQMQGVTFDTMIASYLLASRQRNHNLNDLALEHLNHKMITYEDVCGKGPGQINFSQVDLDTAMKYSGEDADVTLQLYRLFAPQLEELEMTRLFQEVEMPLVRVLATMELTGVKVDVELLEKISKELAEKLDVEKEKIFDLSGARYNIDSPRQLAQVLFEKLKLPSARKTKTGYSTDVKVLRELSLHHPLPARILEYRSLSKLKNTYTDALPKMIKPRTGRLHTSYNQTVTSTGRLSSSDPNLQNIPIRTPEGARIREAFIAEPGWLIFSADYSQIELRLIAHISGDKLLLQSFAKDQDVHARTAAEIFGVHLDLVSSEQRRVAKVINYGLSYGMGAHRLSEELTIPQKEAQEYIDQYFARYPGVHRYMEETVECARREGYVTTIMNRRCYCPEINAGNAQARKAAEREAINAPMQGSAADIIKIAMVRIAEALREKRMKSRMVMQVHDELVFEVPEKEKKALQELVVSIMESAFKLRVPLKVDGSFGKNWREAH